MWCVEFSCGAISLGETTRSLYFLPPSKKTKSHYFFRMLMFVCARACVHAMPLSVPLPLPPSLSLSPPSPSLPPSLPPSLSPSRACVCARYVLSFNQSLVLFIGRWFWPFGPARRLPGLFFLFLFFIFLFDSSLLAQPVTSRVFLCVFVYARV